jgi:hypothetical protein
MKSVINQIQKQLLGNYPELDAIRIRSEKYTIIFNIAYIFGVAVFIIILFFVNFVTFFLNVSGLILYLYILHNNTLPRLEYKKYFDSIKSDYIKMILKQIDNSFEYFDGVIPKIDIMSSELFHKKIDFEGQNYFKGSYNDIKVKISEIECTKPSITSVLFIAELNTNIKTKIFIYDKGLDNDESNPLPVASPNGKRMSLDNKEFKKTFNISVQDINEAAIILSPKFLERILILKSYLNGLNLFMSFCNNKFSVLIYNKLLFDPVLHESIKENKAFYRFFQEVKYILRIVDIMNLNKLNVEREDAT